MLTFDIAGAQIDGARDYQEDAFLITRLGDPGTARTASLIIVADGMGGHAAGNVASNMAVQTFNKHLTSNFPSDTLQPVLREAVLQANNSITETVRETAALKGMGCTLVAAIVEDRQLRWVSVGDSHLYLIRDKEIKKKNADHSYGGFLARMAEQGKPIEPEAGFSRNMLMSALTGDEIADIDCPETALELQPGDRVIIASDGLDTLSHGKIMAFVEATGTAKEYVDALLKAVQDAKMPRQDNTTVIVICVGEKVEARAPASVAAAPPARPAPAFGSATSPRASAPPRIAPVSVVAAPAPSRRGLWLGLLLTLLLIGGGAGYWYLGLYRARVPAGEVPDMLVAESPDATKPAAGDNSHPDVAEGVASGDGAGETTGVDAVAPAPVVRGEPFQDTLRGGGRGPHMISLPGGSFQMGSPETSADFSERPQHTVHVKPFAIGIHEVTIAEYRRFASATARKQPHTGDLDPERHPIFFVSWNDALAYVQWLSSQTGKTYRLPTEAEWEYAARAGTSSAYWWGRELGEGKAHCFACETGLDPRAPTRIGRFAANLFGLFDTAGNLQEWTYDCYHANYEGAPTDGSVFEGGDCKYRVVRGGAFSSGPKGLRCAAREKFPADAANDSIGIRVVRE